MAVGTAAQPVHSSGPNQVLQCLPGQTGASQEIRQIEERAGLPRPQQRLSQPGVHAFHEGQPQAQRILALGGAEQFRKVHVGVGYPQPQPAGVLLEGVQVPEPHGLLVEQGDEELQRVVAAQPGHLVGGEGEGQGVAFGKHIVGVELAEDGLGDGFGNAALSGAGQRLTAVGCHHSRPIAATEGAAHPVGLGGGESAHVHAQLHHLILKHDYPQGALQCGLLQGMIVVPGHPLPAAQELGHAVVGAHAGAHRRDFQCQFVDVPGPRPHDGLHLSGGFHLEHAHGVAPSQVVEDAGIPVVDAAEVRLGAGALAHQPYRPLHLGQRAQGQQVNFQHPGVVHAVLVPVSDVAAGDGRGLHRRQVGEGS